MRDGDPGLAPKILAIMKEVGIAAGAKRITDEQSNALLEKLLTREIERLVAGAQSRPEPPMIAETEPKYVGFPPAQAIRRNHEQHRNTKRPQPRSPTGHAVAHRHRRRALDPSTLRPPIPFFQRRGFLDVSLRVVGRFCVHRNRKGELSPPIRTSTGRTRAARQPARPPEPANRGAYRQNQQDPPDRPARKAVNRTFSKKNANFYRLMW